MWKEIKCSEEAVTLSGSHSVTRQLTPTMSAAECVVGSQSGCTVVLSLSAEVDRQTDTVEQGERASVVVVQACCRRVDMCVCVVV